MSMVSIFTHLSIVCGEHIDFGIYSRRNPQLLGCHPSALACRRRASPAVNSFPPPCAFPSVCGVLNSLLSRHLHIFTRSMSPLFTQTQVPTHYTFQPKAMCYMISANSTFCPYPANLPVHFHIWQSTHL